MSDEEEYEDEEVDEEEEIEEEPASEAAEAPAAEAPPAEEHLEKRGSLKEEAAPKLRPPPPRDEEKPQEEMTEAEQAIQAARKRKEEEDAHKLLNYEEQRKIEKEQIEVELRELREKQQRRRAERDADDKIYAESLKKAEELRRQEEDVHKQKIEAEKNRREEEKFKRQQMIAGSLLGGVQQEGGANYVVQKGSGGLAGPAGGSEKKKRGPTPEQIAAAKASYIAMISRKPDMSNILPNDLKDAIKRLHAKLVRTTGEMFDLQERSKRQEYDLKELHDREGQTQRNKAIKMGLDPSEAGDLKHPPKVNVASKFDRQTDRRGYGDKRVLFEKPYVAPTPKIAHGTARPPPEWGRKKGTGLMDEIEMIRKNLEPPKYVEQAPIEGARPPVDAIPLSIPDEDAVEEPPAPQEVEATA